MASNNNTTSTEAVSLVDVVLTSIFVSTVMIATIIGNSLVIFCVCYYRRLRGRTNYLIVSLAVADWLVGMVSNPFRLRQTINFEKWPTNLNDTGCQFWIWIDMLCSAASILSLMAISIDRLIAILDPLKYEERMRTKHIYIMICIAWLFALVCACLSLVEWKKESVIKITSQCSIASKEYITFVATAAFFIPLVVVLVNYGIIFKVALRHAKHLQMEHVSLATNYRSDVDTNHNEDDASPSGNRRSFLKRPLFRCGRQKGQKLGKSTKPTTIKQLKATKTLAVVVGVFCVCWVPFFIIFLTFQYCPWCFKSPYVSRSAARVLTRIFVQLLPVANSAANPIIYTFFNAEFRRAFKKILIKILGTKKTDDSLSYATACHATVNETTMHESEQKSTGEDSV